MTFHALFIRLKSVFLINNVKFLNLMTITRCKTEKNMNQFHELNILTSRGDLRSSFLLIKSYSEGAARKIMKKAGYYVPDVKGSSFWRFVQDTIATAAKNLTCGYRKGMQTPHAERTVHQVEVCTTEISLSAEVPASTNEKKTQSCARSEMHSTGAGNLSLIHI